MNCPLVKHSAIYRGTVRHRRFYPKHHEFSYESTLFYIDLDELPFLFDDIRGWSLEARNIGRFCRADYLGDAAVPLKQAVQDEVMGLLGYCPQGPVRMLTNLRVWGVCFNPVTFYYVFDDDAVFPRVILAQVNNTPWNQRYCYALECDPQTGKINTHFEKQFHVSPFNPLAMTYRWISTSPAENLVVHLENHAPPAVHVDTVESASAENPILHMDATLTLVREPWSRSALQGILWAQPWLAIKVPVAIYWEALKLLIKRVPFYGHSAMPVATATLVNSNRSGEEAS